MLLLIINRKLHIYALSIAAQINDLVWPCGSGVVENGDFRFFRSLYPRNFPTQGQQSIVAYFFVPPFSFYKYYSLICKIAILVIKNSWSPAIK